jgi:hypothetical protein
VVEGQKTAGEQKTTAGYGAVTCSTLWSGAKLMPRMGLTTLPKRMICSTLLRKASTGIAKPTPLFAPDGL